MVLGYNNDDGAQALDQQQEVDYRRGWQVVNASGGSNLVTDGTGSYEVDVAAGDINTPTGTVTCSAATLDLQSLVDPDLPRIVIVYRNASGVAQTLAGTPAAKQPTGETSPGPIYQPAPDAFGTTDGVVLATVLLEAAASSVGGAQIRDRRMPASLNVDSAEVGSLSADELTNVADHIVESADEIMSLPSEIAEGDTVCIGRPNTPYIIDQQVDIDVSCRVVFQSAKAENGEPSLKCADGSNVSGLRFGFNSAVNWVRVERYGWDGNRPNQATDSTADYLHGLWVGDVDDFKAEDCFVKRSARQKHNNGGSNYHVGSNAVKAEFVNCASRDPGDRGLQSAATETVVRSFDHDNGFDRAITNIIKDTTGTTQIGDDLRVYGGHLRNNSEGSLIGAHGDGEAQIENVKCTGNYRSAIRGFGATLDVRDIVASGGSVAVVALQGSGSGHHIEGVTGRNQGGAGVLNDNDAVNDVTISNCRFDGGGITIWGTDVDVLDCTVVNSNGNGVFVNDGDEVRIRNSTFRNNTNTGILASPSSSDSVTIQNCTVENNNRGGNNKAEIQIAANGVDVIANSIETSNKGIEEFAGGSDVANCYYVGNTIRGSGTFWNLDGTDHTAKANIPSP